MIGRDFGNTMDDGYTMDNGKRITHRDGAALDRCGFPFAQRADIKNARDKYTHSILFVQYIFSSLIVHWAFYVHPSSAILKIDWLIASSVCQFTRPLLLALMMVGTWKCDSLLPRIVESWGGKSGQTVSPVKEVSFRSRVFYFPKISAHDDDND